MLTRLKVSGFKSLLDVDVRFGPFTCIAGTNGVGKSNLFDAIFFLSQLSDLPLNEAAHRVRGGDTSGVQSLFYQSRAGASQVMTFEAEMIVPPRGLDDLGQEAEASITFLQYRLSLGYREDPRWGPLGSFEVLDEELRHITKGEAHRHLLFPHSAKRWRSSVVAGERRAPYFVSTVAEGNDRLVLLHQDGGSRGRPLRYAAATLPRTVLSGANAAESPTALLARTEMRSWRMLQLEPSALRRSDPFTAPTRLGNDGSHLAANLFHLERLESDASAAVLSEEIAEPSAGSGTVYSRIAGRLSELVEDIHDLWVDRDERRELLTLMVQGWDGKSLPAPALSDGSLRFLALAVLESDPRGEGLICLEEPENGIHPDRIPAMLDLLQDIAVDVEEPTGADNPLRQVIVNTHSPAVVNQVPEASLVMAIPREAISDGHRRQTVAFHGLEGTWREKDETSASPMPLGRLLTYLNPVAPLEPGWRRRSTTASRRVVDRDDVQLLLPFGNKHA